MTPDELTKLWSARYSIDPRAHDLRLTYPNRWVRFNTLARGKRYPDTPAEYAIVLKRHNALLSALLDRNRDAVLITTHSIWRGALTPVPGPQTWNWKNLLVNPEDPKTETWHLYAKVIRWQAGMLDSLLRLVAEDVAFNAMILAISEDLAYHPYDGGADVILQNEPQRQSLAAAFPDWVSQRPDRQ